MGKKFFHSQNSQKSLLRCHACLFFLRPFQVAPIPPQPEREFLLTQLLGCFLPDLGPLAIWRPFFVNDSELSHPTIVSSNERQPHLFGLVEAEGGTSYAMSPFDSGRAPMAFTHIVVLSLVMTSCSPGPHGFLSTANACPARTSVIAAIKLVSKSRIGTSNAWGLFNTTAKAVHGSVLGGDGVTSGLASSAEPSFLFVRGSRA
jgi:hypothetical protein